MKQTILCIAALSLTLAVAMVSCNNSAQQQAATQQRVNDSLKSEMAKKAIIDSMNSVNAAKPVMINNEQPVVASPVRSAPVHHSSYHGTASAGSASQGGSAPAPAAAQAPAPAPAPKQRKGIGAVAAGAIIGAGAGAITGAMVDKRKGEGAVVGGILGAGAGAGTGAIIKKEQKKKDAQGE